VERSKWLATVKGLSIALFGAGVGYGCQSVFVNQLAAQVRGCNSTKLNLVYLIIIKIFINKPAQDPPINAMESLFFRSVFQTGA